jgi:hypothetical protein
MLGEKIGETSGKITSQRVLRNLGGGPKMETSFQASGSILGTDVKETSPIALWSVRTGRSTAKGKE